MRKYFLLFLLILSFIESSAQTHPLRKAMTDTFVLLERGRSAEAYNYWTDNSTAHKTDSLYIWANVVVAENFMSNGCFAETETLLFNAEHALNLLKSDSTWWLEQFGYFSTRKAILYGMMHDYTLARTCASDAKISFERISYRGLDYAVSLAVLAEAAFATGHSVLARTFVGQALFVATQVIAEGYDQDNYPYFSYVFRQSGIIELSLGYYNTAIQSFEALKELNKQLNYNDPNIDLYLGTAYVNNGNYEKAIEVLDAYYKDCDLLQAKVSSGIQLLYAKFKSGHTDIAQLAYDIAKFQADNTSRMFSFMSDREKEKWWMSYENRIISIADAILVQSGIDDINGIVADNEIFAKGLLLRSSNMLKHAALSSNDSITINAYYALEGLRGKLTETADEIEQSRLETEISNLEKELQRRLNLSVEEVSSWRDVATSLGNKEVALEFVRFEDLSQADEADYYAIIVKKDDKEPKIIHLFAESALKNIVGKLGNKRIDRYVNELYSTGAAQYKGEQLYNLLWSSLEKEIKGANTIYYSPVGILNSVSLQAVSNGKQCLGQKYVMHLVSSIGNIPHVKNISSNASDRAVIYGGVKYDVDETEVVQAASSYSRGTPDTWDIYPLEVRSGWARLPFTDVEAKEISSMLIDKGYTVETISGVKANEESFKALSGKEINTIHIATHGFFLSEKKDIKKNAFLNPTMSDNVGRIDPMIRSGLLFAGANRVWTGKRGIDGVEDGILTAKEISALDFSKVQLIVLSACQSGLGDVEANEGVYGLQRAFKLAGAETLIMSLWEVDDAATRLLMKTFYEEYLNGKVKDNAFKAAINKVRNYKDETGKTPFSSPYYWAAFIMLD